MRQNEEIDNIPKLAGFEYELVIMIKATMSALGTVHRYPIANALAKRGI
jgi:hypothetical protein